jgi:flagellar biogenesis protein FliO
MSIFQNKKRASLNMIGIIALIILFQLLLSTFILEITREDIKNTLIQECDCGILGCSVYLATHSVYELQQTCQEQQPENTLIKINETIATIVFIIIFIINFILVLCIIFIVRGISQ